MTVLEIVLLIAGVLCVAVSFLVKDGSSESLNTGDEQLKELTEQDKERIRKQIDEILEEKISNISEKTEAQLDKISNTKILEMNDYAKTIMDEINRNHNETVFLYDMLNEKAKEVKSTVKDVNTAKREVARMQYESTITMEEQKKTKSAGTEGVGTKPENAKQVSAYSKNNPTGVQAKGIIASGAKLQQTSKNESPANERTGTGYSRSNHSKDLAKERLIELVRKSNENSKELQRTAQLKVEPLKAAGGDDVKVEKPAVSKTEKAETEAEQKPKTTRKKTAKKAPETEHIEQKNSEDINVNIQFDKNINKNEAIIDMYKRGISNKEIAKQLNLGIGEVRLVIDLFKNTK